MPRTMMAKGDEHTKPDKLKCVSGARLKTEWFYQSVAPTPIYCYNSRGKGLRKAFMCSANDMNDYSL